MCPIFILIPLHQQPEFYSYNVKNAVLAFFTCLIFSKKRYHQLQQGQEPLARSRFLPLLDAVLLVWRYCCATVAAAAASTHFFTSSTTGTL